MLVTFSIPQDSASVIFPEKEIMSEFLAEIKVLKVVAGMKHKKYIINEECLKFTCIFSLENKKFDSKNGYSHAWVKAYTEYKRKNIYIYDIGKSN